MKLLLVATNRERDPFPVAPLGALCVAAAARKAGHEVVFLDLGRISHPVRALRRSLSRDIHAVAFGIRNLDNSSFFGTRSYLDDLRILVEAVRRSTNAPLILGGSGFSVAPAGWLRRLSADYGVVGEGERAFVQLLDCIAAGRGADAVRGVASGSGAGAVAGPAHYIEDLDTLAPPAHEWCHYAGYLRGGGFVSVQTKRGCPFECIYCIYPGIEGRRYRLRAPERVADEIAAEVERSGARHYFFVDSVFNAPREHALALCAEFTRRRLPVSWMALCNPVGLDRELAQAMADAGCIGIEFGLDAATGKMLRALRKPFGQPEIRSAMQAVRAAGLPFAVHMLFGGPGETWRDVEEAQRFLDDCAPANGIFASFGIRVYEGTALASQVANTDLFEPTFFVSPAMEGDPGGNLDRIVRRRPEWTSPADWQKLSMRWIQKLMNRRGVRPQWQNVRNYGLHMRRGGRDPQ